jgi:hypothetical protein
MLYGLYICYLILKNTQATFFLYFLLAIYLGEIKYQK